jgi:uncharacterized protein (DUF1330 family)
VVALRGFMLADSVVFDQDEYDRYRAVVLPSVERHGGRFIIRGGRFERLEGSRQWHRLIGLEFPSFAALRGWYLSAEYQALKAQRLKGATTDMVFVEGTTGRGPEAPAVASAGPLPAYLFGDVTEIRDPTPFKEYLERVAPTLAAVGAGYLSRGGAVEVAEGEWQPARTVLIQFPSWDVATGWYAADAYQELARLRQGCSKTELLLVEGC